MGDARSPEKQVMSLPSTIVHAGGRWIVKVPDLDIEVSDLTEAGAATKALIAIKAAVECRQS